MDKVTRAQFEDWVADIDVEQPKFKFAEIKAGIRTYADQQDATIDRMANCIRQGGDEDAPWCEKDFCKFRKATSDDCEACVKRYFAEGK